MFVSILMSDMSPTVAENIAERIIVDKVGPMEVEEVTVADIAALNEFAEDVATGVAEVELAEYMAPGVAVPEFAKAVMAKVSKVEVAEDFEIGLLEVGFVLAVEARLATWMGLPPRWGCCQ